jgi:hypothetical protein
MNTVLQHLEFVRCYRDYYQWRTDTALEINVPTSAFGIRERRFDEINIPAGEAVFQA